MFSSWGKSSFLFNDLRRDSTKVLRKKLLHKISKRQVLNISNSYLKTRDHYRKLFTLIMKEQHVFRDTASNLARLIPLTAQSSGFFTEALGHVCWTWALTLLLLRVALQDLELLWLVCAKHSSRKWIKK